MPASAIDAGAVEFVGDVSALGEALTALIRGQSLPQSDPRFGTDLTMAAIAMESRRQTGWDMASYKDGTLMRQLTRRMKVLSLPSTADYLEFVRKDPSELLTLRDAMLINVTGFLRDRKSFDSMIAAVRDLVDTKLPGEPIRAWTAGCATGEEAYSIAMLLAEAARASGAEHPVKVFATDISEAAMEAARRGLYTAEELADVPEEWQSRYFVATATGDSFQVDKKLREMLVIARHDITRDPPLVRMDLVSCRNLLIYLVPQVQKRVVANLHAALNPGGVLFLGRSESLPNDDGMFTTLDAGSRLFLRRRGSRSNPGIHPSTVGVVPPPPLVAPRRKPYSLADDVRNRLLSQYGPPSVLLDPNGVPVHMIGSVGRFLIFPDGDSDVTVASVVIPELQTEVATLVGKVLREGLVSAGHHVVVPNPDGPSESLRIQVSRIGVPGDKDPHILVSFVPMEVRTSSIKGRTESDDSVSPDMQELQYELDASREHLQAVIEELESSNEELQAMNEELQASSEELQATNEELETTNEELQATNEELTTVNETLAVRTAELGTAMAVLSNIQSSVHTAIVLLDREQRVLEFSPLAVKAFGLTAQDLGTRLSRLPSHIDVPDLVTLIDSVMSSGEGVVREVSARTTTFLLQVMPYQDEGRITGTVVALSDISELADARKELASNAAQFEVLAATVPNVVYRTTSDPCAFTYVSPTVESIFGIESTRVAEEPNVLLDLIHSSDRQRVIDARNKAGEDLVIDYRIVRPDGALRVVRDTSKGLQDNTGSRYRVGAIVDITDVSRAREEAEVDRMRAEAVFSISGTALATLTADGVILSANEALCRLLDHTEADLLGQPLPSFAFTRDTAIMADMIQQATAGTRVDSVRVRYTRASGGMITVTQDMGAVIVPATRWTPRQTIIFTSMRDLTQLERAHYESQLHAERLDAVFEGAGTAMTLLDSRGNILRCNSAMEGLLGFGRDELVGMHHSSLSFPDDISDTSRLMAELVNGERRDFTIVKRYVARDGSIIWARLVATTPSPEASRESKVIVLSIVDISEEREREAAAMRLSQVDPLTGLLNRMLIFDRLRQAIAMAQRNGTSVSVILVDLDGFKGVNDSMGHEAGDYLLQAVARLLLANARETDSVARLGGDEFLLVAPHHASHSGPDALTLPTGILQSLERLLEEEDVINVTPIAGGNGNGTSSRRDGRSAGANDSQVRNGGLASMTCSVGVAQFPIDGDDVEALYRKADTALYSAKRRGGNQVAFYSERLQDEARLRDVQRLDLLKGLDLGSFEAYYQPITSAAEGKIHGVEVLMRWNHPERGVLSPVDFIDTAEQSNLLDRITERIVRQVADELPVIRTQCPSLQVSINLAPLQMANSALIDYIFSCFGSDLDGLNFELTETAPYDEKGLLSANLERLRAAGAQISLDDFGTGYASLINLRRFGFKEVKIDAEFACSPGQTESIAMVKAIVAMAAALDARTVAEGIETADQVGLMQELGVDLLQGHFFSYPLPCSRLLDWLDQQGFPVPAAAPAKRARSGKGKPR